MLRIADVSPASIEALLDRFDLSVVMKPPKGPVTGSFWGDSEAGIVGRRVFVRPDTPVHSLLHEACHTICMSKERRSNLNRDAGGDDLEETSVCYLQILLADEIAGVGKVRLMQDMDSWGYSFRLGATRRWFENDADDAVEWLLNHGLVDRAGLPTFKLRGGV